MYKGGDCIQETRNNSRKNRVCYSRNKGLIMALALMVSITIHWKKFRAKQPFNDDQGLEFRERQLLDKEDSMVFTLEQMMEATHTFSRKVGESTFGPVFFGKLPDGKEIAVKVLSSNCEQEIREFFTEVHLISRVHHKNLLSLLGYCDESEKHMLIYDYMCEGCLSDCLYGQRAGLPKLNWKRRLKIAIDVAEALQYLHVCCIPMIIHRHVKSANILLDSDLNGKLGDFGFSKMTMDRKAPIVDIVKGTYGYSDPEYISTGLVTQKNDVYSFGVVLLEIICGRNAFDKDLPSEERLLSMWVRDYVGINENPGKIVEIIDKKMEGTYHMKSITIVASVALKCLQGSSCRPCICEVVGELKEAFMYEKVKWES